MGADEELAGRQPSLFKCGQKHPERAAGDERTMIVDQDLAQGSTSVHRALLMACARADSSTALRLLSDARGALSPAQTGQDSRGYQPLHFACASGCLKLVIVLCEGEGPHFADAAANSAPFANRPVAVAAVHGHLNIVKYLAHFHKALEQTGEPGAWTAFFAEGAPAPLVPIFPDGEAEAPLREETATENIEGQRQKVLEWLLKDSAKQFLPQEALRKECDALGVSDCSTDCESPGPDERERQGRQLAWNGKASQDGFPVQLTLSQAQQEGQPVERGLLQRASSLVDLSNQKSSGSFIPGRMANMVRNFSKQSSQSC